jgi:hypothetical protein
MLDNRRRIYALDNSTVQKKRRRWFIPPAIIFRTLSPALAGLSFTPTSYPYIYPCSKRNS